MASTVVVFVPVVFDAESAMKELRLLTLKEAFLNVRTIELLLVMIKFSFICIVYCLKRLYWHSQLLNLSWTKDQIVVDKLLNLTVDWLVSCNTS